jgi:hypothetical protein
VRTSSALGRYINARVEFKKQVSCPWQRLAVIFKPKYYLSKILIEK